VAKPSTVLFDLDGTLLDTAPDFITCLNAQRRHRGLEALPSATVRRAVSNGARAMVKLGFDLEPGDSDYDRVHGEFLDRYEAHLAIDSCLFPGMDAVLGWLEQQAIPWGIVTNKPSRFTLPLLKGLELNHRCAVTICPDDVVQRKPHPESLLLACERLGVDAGEGIYVGDHIRDIQAGREAGMITVAARYGYIEDLGQLTEWQADLVIDDAWSLLQWLRERAEKQTGTL
jgi:2-phosphoglycolate phosphatase